MGNLAVKHTTDIEELSSKLSSTLDEAVFFSELERFFIERSDKIKESRILLVLDDKLAKVVSKNGKPVTRESICSLKEELAVSHVIRTKCPYFSNNASNDPICNGATIPGQAILCVPIIQEGVVIAAISIQSKVGAEFGTGDITEIISVLNTLKQPLRNMKMYICAKNLNRTLLKKIEQKEEGQKIRSSVGSVVHPYQVQDKNIVFESKAMKNIIKIADKAAKSNMGGFIYGEKGSGREMLAKRIHCKSVRKERGFAAIDCSIFTDGELEIELFGQEGSGGVDKEGVRKGIVETIDGGTLFLDNIENVGSRLQYKLNLMISDGIFFRVGGASAIKTYTRILASTTVNNIQSRVECGTFSEDLFCNLNSISITMASLRERKEDIAALAFHFINLNRSSDRQKSFSDAAIKALMKYDWPGNVRELQSIAERAYIMSEGSMIEEKDLPDFITNFNKSESEDYDTSFVNMTLQELERKHICKTLATLGGNKTKTAKTLGITVKTLYNKLHNYGIVVSRNK